MNTILERVRGGEILFCDGAMGTFLQNKGLEPGECPELWCVDKPDAVADVHQRYLDAGCDMVETNSFGANRYKLGHYGLAARTAELNAAAARLARRAAGEDRYVLGSVGPTGAFMKPYGTEDASVMVQAFSEQIGALKEGGVDMIIIETMTALEEMLAALQAVREVGGIEAVASFTFERQASGGYATMMGVRPQAFAEAVIEGGAAVVGVNCGTGPRDMVEIVKLMRPVVGETPLMAMPNAGLPVVENEQTVFKQTPEEMAGRTRELVEAGALMIGGCCGTTPDHILAMRKAVQDAP